MPTTVQIDEKTSKMLTALKKKLRAKSQDEVIRILIAQRRVAPKSLFGFARGSKPYTHDVENNDNKLT